MFGECVVIVVVSERERKEGQGQRKEEREEDGGLVLFLLLLADSFSEPVKALIEAVASGGAGGLHVPRVGRDLVHLKTIGDLLGAEGIWQILFVGKDEDDGGAELGRFQHTPQLQTCLLQAVGVVTVDDEDHGLCIEEVVAPQSTDLFFWFQREKKKKRE